MTAYLTDDLGLAKTWTRAAWAARAAVRCNATAGTGVVVEVVPIGGGLFAVRVGDRYLADPSAPRRGKPNDLTATLDQARELLARDERSVGVLLLALERVAAVEAAVREELFDALRLLHVEREP